MITGMYFQTRFDSGQITGWFGLEDFGKCRHRNAAQRNARMVLCRYCWKIRLAFFRFFSYTLNTAVAACIFAAGICFCKAGFFGQRYSLINYPLCYTFLQFSYKNLLRPVQDKISKKIKKIMVKPLSAKY